MKMRDHRKNLRQAVYIASGENVELVWVHKVTDKYCVCEDSNGCIFTVSHDSYTLELIDHDIAREMYSESTIDEADWDDLETYRMSIKSKEEEDENNTNVS